MHKLRSAFTALAVAGATAITVTAGAGPAAAAAPAALTGGAFLPVNGVADVAVDPTHQQVLITDMGSGELLSLSYFGGVQRSVVAGAEAQGVGLSPDNSTVYVTVGSEHEIMAFDAATLRVKRAYDVGEQVWPRDVTEIGGKIWFAYDKGLGSLDVATGEQKLYDVGLAAQIPLLLTAPGAPGTVVVADAWRFAPGSGRLAVFDVSSGTAVVKTKGQFGDGSLRNAALTPDGSSLIGFGSGCTIWKSPLSDLGSRTVAYDNGLCEPVSVDINTDGRVAVSNGNFDGTADVTVWPAGSAAPAEQFTGPASDEVWQVVWEPGGDRLFAFSASNEDWTFWPIHGSQPVRSTMTINAPATVAPGDAVRITGKLSRPGGTVRLTRDYPNTQALKKQVDVTTADENGNFTLTDASPDAVPARYTASYGGTDTVGPAFAAATVLIQRTTPALTVSHHNSVNGYGSTVTVTAHLGTTRTNRMVQIWADPYGAEPARLLRNYLVDAKGNLTASLKLTRNTVIEAKFLGDTKTAPASARSVLYTRPAVTLQPSRQYKAAKIGSVPYRFYRTTVHPYFLTTMTPYPGRKQRLELDVYSGGKWKPWRVLNLPLNSAGKSAFTLTGTHPAGARYRARTAYVYGTSGDTANYTTYTPYYYFTFTK
ncbi:hypothetical protein Ade02nite_39930 [Paractinoplanes deccanensis]|uniref:Uncharacterized protein n=2 Tax=Paractinoplanes deccanensis TaxID=113561 RepID=A0ABQ3Y5T8_9ACTN|nr:hypothetical protein Ade02nite_39930 [Actinoplanes deccanensis]